MVIRHTSDNSPAFRASIDLPATRGARSNPLSNLLSVIDENCIRKKDSTQNCVLSFVNDMNCIIMAFLFYTNHGTHEEQPGNGSGDLEHNCPD
jgi:hypothetical protein